MAILDNIPGIEVIIIADDKPKEETNCLANYIYDNLDETITSANIKSDDSSPESLNGKWTIRYIAAKQRQVFSLEIKVKPSFTRFVTKSWKEYTTFTFRVLIDGVAVAEPLVTLDRLKEVEKKGYTLPLAVNGTKIGTSDGPGYVKPFRFTEIDSTYNDMLFSPAEIAKQERLMSSVGKVVIEVCMLKTEDIDFTDEQIPKGLDVTSAAITIDFNQQIHEDSMNSTDSWITHGINYGPPVFTNSIGKASHIKTKNPDLLGIFIFKYRSQHTINHFKKKGDLLPTAPAPPRKVIKIKEGENPLAESSVPIADSKKTLSPTLKDRLTRIIPNISVPNSHKREREMTLVGDELMSVHNSDDSDYVSYGEEEASDYFDGWEADWDSEDDKLIERIEELEVKIDDDLAKARGKQPTNLDSGKSVKVERKQSTMWEDAAQNDMNLSRSIKNTETTAIRKSKSPPLKIPSRRRIKLDDPYTLTEQDYKSSAPLISDLFPSSDGQKKTFGSKNHPAPQETDWPPWPFTTNTSTRKSSIISNSMDEPSTRPMSLLNFCNDLVAPMTHATASSMTSTRPRTPTKPKKPSCPFAAPTARNVNKNNRSRPGTLTKLQNHSKNVTASATSIANSKDDRFGAPTGLQSLSEDIKMSISITAASENSTDSRALGKLQNLCSNLEALETTEGDKNEPIVPDLPLAIKDLGKNFAASIVKVPSSQLNETLSLFRVQDLCLGLAAPKDDVDDFTKKELKSMVEGIEVPDSARISNDVGAGKPKIKTEMEIRPISMRRQGSSKRYQNQDEENEDDKDGMRPFKRSKS